MKIPEPLPQFEDQRTLLILAGHQAADLYLADKGDLQKVRSVKVRNPVYSDREEFFTSSGQGVRLGSGSVYENKKQATQTKFLNRMEDAIKDILRARRNIGSLYIFAPAAHASAITTSLPTKARGLLKRVYSGNYVKLGPLDALEKIFEKREARKTAVKRALAPEKAKKVLEKSRQARRVVGK